MDSAVEPQNDITIIFLQNAEHYSERSVVLVVLIFYYFSLPGEAIFSWRLQEP